MYPYLTNTQKAKKKEKNTIWKNTNYPQLGPQSFPIILPIIIQNYNGFPHSPSSWIIDINHVQLANKVFKA